MSGRSLKWPTLVEWIVLAACGVIVAALLLPAMSHHPRPVRRTQCANNLKNLALATVNFETTKRRFPGYLQLFGASGDQSGKIGSWFVTLLPYVEQQALRDLWDDPAENERWVAGVRGTAAEVERFFPQVSVMICPSDSTTFGTVAPSSYVSNNGLYVLADDPALGLETFAGAESDSQRGSLAQRKANGLFNNQLPATVTDPKTGLLVNVFGPATEQVSSLDVRDGLSQTLLFAENHHGLSWRATSATDARGQILLGMVWLYAGKGASEGRPEPCSLTEEMRLGGPNRPGLLSPRMARPSSTHSGQVINAAMADGSVISLSPEIDYHVYQALLTPDSANSDMPDPTYRLIDADWRW